MSLPHERHNELVAEFVQKVLRETGTEAECMVVLESILVAAMMLHRPRMKQAAEFLDVMTERVLVRLAQHSARAGETR